MPYVDGFIVPVPKKNVKAYRTMSKKAGKVWSDYGALDYKECVADDVKMGKWTSFPRSVKMKKNETVVFSYIVYKSRADRDRCIAKVMKDPRLAEDDGPEEDAVRRQAHDLRRVQGVRRRVTACRCHGLSVLNGSPWIRRCGCGAGPVRLDLDDLGHLAAQRRFRCRASTTSPPFGLPV